MKFTGIVASLAVASTASAAAIPQAQVPVEAVTGKLNGALGSLHSVLGGVLGGLLGETDLTQLGDIKTTLTEVKGQLTKLAPVKRDGPLDAAVEAPKEAVTEGVEGAGTAVGSVVHSLGVRDDQLSGLTNSIIGKLQSGDLNADGLNQVLSLLSSGNGVPGLSTLLGLL